jgi:hypothetical protein
VGSFIYIGISCFFYSIFFFFSFLKAEIRDRKGNNYSNAEVGIPQGSPLSPILMKIFLHRMAKQIEEAMVKDGVFIYSTTRDMSTIQLLECP